MAEVIIPDTEFQVHWGTLTIHLPLTNEVAKANFDHWPSSDTTSFFKGGQNQQQATPSMGQGPMTPMMPSNNMQQSGQLMVSDPNGKKSKIFIYLIEL